MRIENSSHAWALGGPQSQAGKFVKLYLGIKTKMARECSLMGSIFLAHGKPEVQAPEWKQTNKNALFMLTPDNRNQSM